MDPVAAAVLASWKVDPGLLCALFLAAAIYLRGARKWPARYTAARITAFLGGLATIFVALASPLDAFGGLLLQVHMIQHLLLIAIAPPLLLLGQPVLAMLRGLPKPVFKDGLGPFLAWGALRRVGRALTHPITGWTAMAAAIVVWHMPLLYELGLRSPAWHEVQHACFFTAGILFWWPVIEVWPGHAQWPRWAMIPYLISADLVNTALSAALTFSGRVWYPTYEAAPRLWGIQALSDQATAGAVMWVPGSIVFLIPAIAIVMRLASPPRVGQVHDLSLKLRKRQAMDLSYLQHLIGKMYIRRIAQTLMFLLAAVIVADGLFGSPLSPLNLAGVLPWTHWRGFVVIALLVAGNLFCFACPFTLVRDLGRRLLPARRLWPRALRSKWLAAGLFATYLWAYEALRLWDRPWWTAWIVIGYFTTAFLVDGIFQDASFCKYVCPIGQFHFVNSFVSPLEVKVRQPQVCNSCTTHDCLRGNAQHRGCELHLFQPEKRGNFDCTFCLDCVRACPAGNVAILPASPARRVLDDRKLYHRPDVLALVLAVVFGAFANAAGMTAPVMIWMHGWHARLGVSSMLPLTAMYYAAALIAIPALAVLLCRWAARDLAGRFILALIPLGFSMWLAHFSFHLATGWRGVLARFTDIAGATPAPSWLPSLELLALDCGLILTLYIAWRVATKWRERLSSAFAAAVPWAMLALALYAAGFWIVLQPMERMS